MTTDLLRVACLAMYSAITGLFYGDMVCLVWSNGRFILISCALSVQLWKI